MNWKDRQEQVYRELAEELRQAGVQIDAEQVRWLVEQARIRELKAAGGKTVVSGRIR